MIKPDPDANTEESIPETEHSTDKPHSTNNDTTDTNNAAEENTIPDMVDEEPTNEPAPYTLAMHTPPHRATRSVNLITGPKKNVFTGGNLIHNTYTGGYVHAMVAYEHLEELRK